MPLSTDVRLARDDEAVFPDRCCGCLRERPGEAYVVNSRRASLSELLFPWLWLTREVVRRSAPICAECLRRAVAQRWRRRWLLIACGVASIPVIVWLTPSDLARGQRRAIQLVCVVLALLPCGVLHIARPPLFDVTVGKHHVDHEFANASYAELFRVMNARALQDR